MNITELTVHELKEKLEKKSLQVTKLQKHIQIELQKKKKMYKLLLRH